MPVPRFASALLALSVMLPTSVEAQASPPRMRAAFSGLFVEPRMRDWMDAHQGDVQACADNAEGPMLEGYLHVVLSVSPTGELEDFTIEPDNVQNPGFASCVVHLVRGVPLEGRGRPTSVRIPIRVER
jgi:hypothetical protein